MKKMGRKSRAFFRICATDTRSPRDGRVIEELGTYDPSVPETDARVILNGERVDYWLSVGAQPSPKVSVLIKKYGKDGTHLDAQKSAIERLGGRRQKAVEAAIAAVASIPSAPEPTAEAEAVVENNESTDGDGNEAEAVATEASTDE
ncbi:MAG: 30S ribosomal protein S16 [Pirellulaceae bacterium]